MKRSEITPGEVYSKLSYRDSRQGWPVLILSTDSYERNWRTDVLMNAAGTRLRSGNFRVSTVGLLAVSLGFSMHSGRGEDGTEPPMDVLEFRARVEQVRELVSVKGAIEAIEQRARDGWSGDHNALLIHDAEGTVVASYELLTGLQMVAGPYIALTLAERQRQAQSTRYAHEHERQRVANVGTFRALAERLDKLGITGYHVADWESPTRFEAMAFDDMDALLCLAEDGALRSRFK